MTKLLFDLETDGLLQEVSKIHCLVTIDVDSEDVRCYHGDPTITPRHGSISEGIETLKADDVEELSGHNILEYDEPVLGKLRGFKWPRHKMFDTLVMSRLAYSDRKEKDFALHRQERLPAKFIGQHSLGAWGHRLGENKAEYSGGWEEFSQDMLDYCVQDCRANLVLYRHLKSVVPSWQASNGMSTVVLEHLFAGQLFDQQQRGVKLDLKAMDRLLEVLIERKAALLDEIRELYPDLEIPYKINKRTGKRATYFCPIRNKRCDSKLVPFNPGSRPQLASRLIKNRGWVPQELTKKGNPTMVESILLDLCDIYPEVKPVAEYLIVNARISLLSDSAGSYTRLMDEDGVLHGRCLHIGAVTHRCSHTSPNTSNVTSIRKPFGKEIRGLFIPFPGKIQAGHDADGLELRMLANYLYPYDGGAYARAVDEGKKEDGTDPHSLHAAAISSVVHCDRDSGKTGTYAYLYGAGDRKLGKIYGGGAKLGAQVRNALTTKIPGLAQLQEALAAAVERGWILSLDGRRVGIRHLHAALNTLLQTAGAVVMRWVPVEFERIYDQNGGRYGHDFLQTGHVHDEVQGSLLEALREIYAESVKAAYKSVEELLNLNVPLKGTPEFGMSWADTH